VFFTISGSEANDTQIKLAWYYNNARGQPKRKKIISRHRGLSRHHRRPASLSGLPCSTPTSICRWRACCTPTARTTASTPSRRERGGVRDRLARNLEDMIEQEGPDTIAAFIAEPVMGRGGVLIPPKTYFEKVQAVLSRHGIAFIADEVICGFGATGNWWGSETYGIAPDTVTMAKA
jgi:4-aminobutyrate--pyruvate transaminase